MLLFQAGKKGSLRDLDNWILSFIFPLHHIISYIFSAISAEKKCVRFLSHKNVWNLAKIILVKQRLAFTMIRSVLFILQNNNIKCWERTCEIMTWEDNSLFRSLYSNPCPVCTWRRCLYLSFRESWLQRLKIMGLFKLLRIMFSFLESYN